jgi:hypothetical protein
MLPHCTSLVSTQPASVALQHAPMGGGGGATASCMHALGVPPAQPKTTTPWHCAGGLSSVHVLSAELQHATGSLHVPQTLPLPAKTPVYTWVHSAASMSAAMHCVPMQHAPFVAQAALVENNTIKSAARIFSALLVFSAHIRRFQRKELNNCGHLLQKRVRVFKSNKYPR